MFLYDVTCVDVAYTRVHVGTAIRETLRLNLIPASLGMKMSEHLGVQVEVGEINTKVLSKHLLVCKFSWMLSRLKRKGTCNGRDGQMITNKWKQPMKSLEKI